MPQAGNPKKEYTVKKIFRTVQGEGFWSGTSAVFVRFVGCNMWSGFERDRERDGKKNTPGKEARGCPTWCDTDFTPEGSSQMSGLELAREVKKCGPTPLVVLTGGEPLLQADDRLMDRIHEECPGIQIAVETNGTVSLEDTFESIGYDHSWTPDWVCCSPKVPEGQLKIEACDEAKLVLPDYKPQEYLSLQSRCRERKTPAGYQKHLYVQPEDGPRFAAACREARLVARDRAEWRISTQSHKTVGAA